MPSRKRLIVAAVLLAVLASTAPAGATSKPNLYILWMEGSTLSDWSSPALPAFHALLKEAAIGLLSTRTKRESADPRALRANAALTFNAGAEGGFDLATNKPAPISGVHYTLLGDALARAGYAAFASRPVSSPDGLAALALASSNGNVRVTGDLVVPAGPFAEIVDVSRGPLAASDAQLAVVRARMRPGDVLVVVSAAPTPERLKHGVRLGAVAIEGSGFSAGLLTSETTRRVGVITLTDLAPTIASALDLPPLAGANGRIATVKYRSNAATGLISFERDIVRAALQRRVVTRWPLIAGMIVVAIAAFLVLVRLHDARMKRVAWLSTALVAVATAPLAIYVGGVFHPSSAGIALIEIAALCVVLASALRARLDAPTSLAVVMVLTAVAPLIDLLLGTPLAARSSVEFQIAGGGRFYGVGDEGLGIVVGAVIFAVALLFDRARDARRAGAIIALVFAASVWLLGAPSLGSKFGAAPTAVPAFGVLAVVIGGKRFTRASIALIATATVAATGLLVAVDALRKSGTQTHIARAVEGRSSVAAILSDKIHAQWQITTHTIWTPAVALFAIAIVMVMRRRAELFARATEWHTLFRPALLAALVGGIAGFAFNDGGILTTAPIALFAAASTFAVLLTPRAG